MSGRIVRAAWIASATMLVAIFVVAALAADGLWATNALPQGGRTLEAVLQAVGRYVAELPETIGGVVLDEDYFQQAGGSVVRARQMRADLSVIPDRQFGWIEFRDVYEVDGRPVRDRENRVVALFAKPDRSALEQARRIVGEGARFNLSPLGVTFTRTINLPMAALAYLRPGNLPRSTFRHDGTDSVAGRRVVVVQFRETSRPRIIGLPDDSGAQGTFWIEPDSGRVLRSELKFLARVGAQEIHTAIQTEYAEDRRLGVWLPRQMDEDYAIRSIAGAGAASATLVGRAIYRDAKRFDVVVEERAAGEAAPAR